MEKLIKILDYLSQWIGRDKTYSKNPDIEYIISERFTDKEKRIVFIAMIFFSIIVVVTTHVFVLLSIVVGTLIVKKYNYVSDITKLF